MRVLEEPHSVRRRAAGLLFFFVLLSSVQAFSPAAMLHTKQSTQLHVIPPVAASLIAGSVSGAIGIGVAYPLDTLKTKAQLMSNDGRSPNILKILKYVYENEGIQGFFGGVRTMMIGQALIKAVAFCANDSAVSVLESMSWGDDATTFFIGACISGFVTSFVTTPAERVKIIMQANGKAYKNDWECFTSILKSDGIEGLFKCGLGATLLRDTPSYGLYFAVYHVLMNTDLAHVLGNVLAPISFGAFSGCLSWVPIYPIDVVKTLIQNRESGTEKTDAFQVAQQLYESGGIGVFFDGLTPKMLRAGVCNSINFYLYDILMHAMTTSQ